MLSLDKRTLLLCTALLLLIVIAVVEYALIRDLGSRQLYTNSDEPLINVAASDLSRELGVSEDELMRGRFPVVIQINDVKCVSLKMRETWLGESYVACFDRHGRRMKVVEFS